MIAFTGFSQDVSSKKRAILQGIVSLLPSQRDSISCKFLLKLLRSASAVKRRPHVHDGSGAVNRHAAREGFCR
jgi:hypothetical protein